MKPYMNKTRVASPMLHATSYFTMFVFAAIITMSYVFKVEIVAQGLGKIVPLDRVQVVQSEFAGQIAAIHVKNGSSVEKGQVLIELDETDAQTEVNTLQAELSRLEIEKHRLAVLIQMSSVASNLDQSSLGIAAQAFGEADQSQDSLFHAEQAKLLEAELVELLDGLAQIETRRSANEKSKEVTRANIARIEAALETQTERLEITKSLLEKGTASRSTYLDVFDGFTRLQNEREIYAKELDQKTALESTYDAERRSLISSLRSRQFARQSDIDARLFELNEQLVSSKRRLKNSKLTAPVAGTIDKLNVFTVGGVISASQELMRVVPQDSAFEVEAVFPNTDVGFLEIGQKANVKLDAFPSERFGVVEGVVTSVSADAIEIGEGTNEFGFVVRIAPDQPFLKTPANQYPLQTGMTAITDVITGDRRIISYFFAPILRTIEESLGER